MGVRQSVVIAETPDVQDLPLDADLEISAAEYARIMRRIGEPGGTAETPVSAFNSSI